MSDTGAPNFPEPSARIERPAPARSETRFESEIINLPKDISEARTNIRLRGTVERIERDQNNEVRRIIIRTPRGEVSVKPQSDQTLPREGQTVEVEIRAQTQGTQATQSNAIVRYTPSVSTPRDTSNAPARHSQTPVNVEIRDGAGAQNTVAPPDLATISAQIKTQIAEGVPQTQSTLEIGNITRLSALPVSVIEAIATTITAQTTQTVQTTQAQFMPQSLPSVMTQVGNEVAQVSVVSSPAPIIVASDTLSALAPLSQQTQVPQVSPDFLSFQTAQITTAGAQAGALASLEATAQAFPLEALSVTTNPNIPQGGANLPEVFDVRIARIIPPSGAMQVMQNALPMDAPLTLAETLQAAQAENTKPTILQNVQAGNIHATVIATTAEGAPVVSLFLAQSADGQIFALHAPSDTLVPGTQIELSPLSIHAPAGALSSAQAAVLPLSVFTAPEPWPMMGELMQTLSQTNPQMAQVFSSLVPQAGNPAQLPPAAMLFLAVVSGGDLSAWMGEKTMDILRRSGKTSLLNRINGESGLLGRLSESSSGDWRSAMLPLSWNNEINKVALHYKHDKQGQDEHNQNGTQTRFLFDLSLPNMGKVQLDGLYRPFEAQKRLDLILRTEAPFSKAMQMDMKRTYTIAIDQTELMGELSFQNELSKWVTVDVQDERFGAEA